MSKNAAALMESDLIGVDLPIPVRIVLTQAGREAFKTKSPIGYDNAIGKNCKHSALQVRVQRTSPDGNRTTEWTTYYRGFWKLP